MSAQPPVGAKTNATGKPSQTPDSELDPPFEVIEPPVLLSPLVFSSPHSGSVYPRRFLECSQLEAMVLRRSEDAFVDELFAGVRAVGAPLIRAKFPRCFLDLNREPYELDQRMFEGQLPAFVNTRSVRVASGLGTIPRVVGQAQEIYRARLSVEEAMERIERFYKPYHDRLRELLARAQQTFGVAVLVDCHSMPSGAFSNGGLHGALPFFSPHLTNAASSARAEFVIGDRHGTSCAGAFIEIVEDELRRSGYAVRRNKPYAGGFITEYYGDPAADRHAMQIEVSRALYMDEHDLEKSEKFDEVSNALTRVAERLAAKIAERRNLLRPAAE